MAINIYPAEIPKVGFQPWAFKQRKPCEGVYMRRTAQGVPVVSVHYSADPELSIDTLRDLSLGMSEVNWDMEMEGHAEAADGQLVFPEFSPQVHVVPHDSIPPLLCRFMSIDPHVRTPHAMLWVGIDAEEDVWVYRELWPSPVYGQHRNMGNHDKQDFFTVMQYTQLLAEMEGNSIDWSELHTEGTFGTYREKLDKAERILARYMDQAGKGFMASGENDSPESISARYARFGITCFDPDKRHKGGEDAIRELLKTRPHAIKGLWPRLHISDSCVELIYEFQRYRFKAIAEHRLAEQELKQGGVNVRCHMIDNLRYLATANLYYERSLASPEAETIFKS